MTWWWSYLLSAVGVAGLLLAGSKRKVGWMVGLGAQGLWLTYAIVTRQYGFIIACVAYGGTYLRNWLRWRRDETKGRRVNERTGEVYDFSIDAERKAALRAQEIGDRIIEISREAYEEKKLQDEIERNRSSRRMEMGTPKNQAIANRMAFEVGNRATRRAKKKFRLS